MLMPAGHFPELAPEAATMDAVGFIRVKTLWSQRSVSKSKSQWAQLIPLHVEDVMPDPLTSILMEHLDA